MSSLREIELTCPICFSTFVSRTVVPGNLLSMRTDFHERTKGPQPLPYLVHTCSKCGYSGSAKVFSSEATLGPDVREHVWDELAPKLPTTPLTGSEKYELAAKVAMWQGAEPQHVADAFLRAAWCCVDERDFEAERYFRRYAVWGFENALESQQIARDERAMFTYLIGELWRRIGDVKRARQWFDRVPSEITNAEDEKWILDAARQQRDHPREWF